MSASTWTKADLRRMQAGLDLVDTWLNRGTRYDAPDEYREGVNASLDGLAIVREYLHSLVCSGENSSRAAAEGRAATCLLDRLETESLPRELLKMPRLLLHREVVAQLAAEEEAERERVAQLGMRAYESQLRVEELAADTGRDLRIVLHNLDDFVQRGMVEAHRADAYAFNTDTKWSDVPGRTSWWMWARPTAERRSAERGFDRCVQHGVSAWLPTDALAMRSLWDIACDIETAPFLLDLRGIPTSSGPGNIPDERWLTALRRLIERSDKGLVLLVDCEAWVVARLLPQRVGATS